MEAIKIDPTFEDAKLNLQQAIEDSKNASAEWWRKTIEE